MGKQSLPDTWNLGNFPVMKRSGLWVGTLPSRQTGMWLGSQKTHRLVTTRTGTSLEKSQQLGLLISSERTRRHLTLKSYTGFLLRHWSHHFHPFKNPLRWISSIKPFLPLPALDHATWMWIWISLTAKEINMTLARPLLSSLVYPF